MLQTVDVGQKKAVRNALKNAQRLAVQLAATPVKDALLPFTAERKKRQLGVEVCTVSAQDAAQAERRWRCNRALGSAWAAAMGAGRRSRPCGGGGWHSWWSRPWVSWQLEYLSRGDGSWQLEPVVMATKGSGWISKRAETGTEAGRRCSGGRGLWRRWLEVEIRPVKMSRAALEWSWLKLGRHGRAEMSRRAEKGAAWSAPARRRQAATGGGAAMGDGCGVLLGEVGGFSRLCGVWQQGRSQPARASGRRQPAATCGGQRRTAAHAGRWPWEHCWWVARLGKKKKGDKKCAGPPWTKPAGPWWTGCSKNCAISLLT